EPVEEDAAAGAHGRIAALERRPGDAAARREVQAADVRLEFLPDAGAGGQVLAHADVVLDVERQLGLRGGQRWIAKVARERRRPRRRIVVEAGKGEGAAAVAELVGLV